MKFSSLSFFKFVEKKNNIVIFNSSESHHILKVKKIPRNNYFFATDGEGKIYKLQLINVEDKKAIAEIIDIFPNSGYLPIKIIVAVSLCEKKRFEFIIEKLTELGISEIIPLITERSNIIKLNYERLEKISISSLKQSGRSKLVKINKTIEISNFFNKKKECINFSKIVMDINENKSQIDNNKNDKILFIGPEGGWTKNEILYFKEYNCNFLNFGYTTLRVETAAIAGVVILIDKLKIF